MENIHVDKAHTSPEILSYVTRYGCIILEDATFL